MELTGVHFLLTYQCTFACDHCFVWGSPWQQGSMSLADVDLVLDQAEELGTVQSVFFEGGEPFLYYATLVEAVRRAADRGFSVGVVSNGYWATSIPDAVLYLRPMAGWSNSLSISADFYHYTESQEERTHNATMAASELGIPLGVICIAEPEGSGEGAVGQIPHGESVVVFRGRAAEALSARAPGQPFVSFTSCQHETLDDPGRIHVDCSGNVHVCQGVIIGNVNDTPLKQIWAEYDPVGHPIVGPLLTGGPAELARRYELPVADSYADACHLCFETRKALRDRFPEILGPDAMYSAPE